MIQDKCTNIADNLHGIISISDFEKKVISTTIFNRLHNIHQNSTAYLTYPANRTKRFEHSLGTMFLSNKIFFHSIANADESTLNSFFTSAEDCLNGIKESISKNSEYSIKLFKRPGHKPKNFSTLLFEGGIYSIYIPSNIKPKDKWIYCILLQGIRIAALLHDIGHPPFSHVTESAINSIYKELTSASQNDDKCSSNFEFVVKDHVEGGKQLHEEIGKIVTKMLMLSVIDDTEVNAFSEVEYSNQLFKLIVGELVLGIFEENSPFLKDLHKVIDGTLDGDRLDYISRDPLNSGIDVGKIEYERLLNSMKLIYTKERFVYCPSIKVINTLDNFFQRRLEMYKTIIYHHRVVKTDYLLKDTIFRLSIDFIKNNSELDDTDGDILPYNISGVWKAIQKSVSEYEFSQKIIQWDDAWLMTVLKKHYFASVTEKSILNSELSELLTNQKSYYSVIKKKEDYYDIDFAVSESLKLKKDEIYSMIKLLREGSKNTSAKEIVDIEPYLTDIEDVFETIKDYEVKESIVKIGGPIISKISKSICVEYINPIDEIISLSLNEIKNNWKISFEDIIIANKGLNSGLSDALYLYNEKNGLVKYQEVSNATNNIKNDINYFTRFFIYVLITEKKDKTSIDYESFRRDIGKEIGKQIGDSVVLRLSKFRN